MYLDIEFADNEIERMKLELRADFTNTFLKEREAATFMKNIVDVFNIENKEEKALKQNLIDKIIEEETISLENKSKIRNEETNFNKNLFEVNEGEHNVEFQKLKQKMS